MNRFLTTALAISTLPVFFTSQPARADSCKDSVSHIRLPDGKCYDLAYLTRTSAARSFQGQAANLYRQIVRDNTPTTATSTVVAGDSDSYVGRSTTVSENLTPEERAERKETIAKAGKGMGKIEDFVREIENDGYRKHLRIMSNIQRSFTSR